MNEDMKATLEVIKVFDGLGIPYLIGGSLASSIHGKSRATLDADLLADVKQEHVPQLVAQLGADFYVDTGAIESALRHRTSFNLINFKSGFKVDVFVVRGRPFDRQQLRNRVHLLVATSPDTMAYVASAEDTILSKLEWYRLGNEVSDRQWTDIMGVINLQGARLNLDSLREGAAQLGVTDLLEQALRDATG